jgi:hypothetical protein
MENCFYYDRGIPEAQGIGDSFGWVATWQAGTTSSDSSVYLERKILPKFRRGFLDM